MEIASSGASGKGGGLYGNTREGGARFHNGVDIKADINQPFVAMYGGKVVEAGFIPKDPNKLPT